MAEEFGGHYSLVFRRLFVQLRSCKRATVKLQIVGTASVLNGSRRGLKVSPNKLLTYFYALDPG